MNGLVYGSRKAWKLASEYRPQEAQNSQNRWGSVRFEPQKGAKRRENEKGSFGFGWSGIWMFFVCRVCRTLEALVGMVLSESLGGGGLVFNRQ